MSEIVLKKGLDLPILGAPEGGIVPGPEITSVAVVGPDTIGLKPKMLVAEGDRVQRGQALYSHKDIPEVMFTAPATGRVRAINRGARRVLESVVIDIEDAADPGIDFGTLTEAEFTAETVAEKLCAAGLWASLRTRPYSKVPTPGQAPAAVFITALDTEPLALDPMTVIDARAEDFRLGVAAVAALTEGKTYLCHAPGAVPPGADLAGVEAHAFSGPHPAGLPGTHIHFLEPIFGEKIVWQIGYQDVIAIGALMATGHFDPRRVVALCGPMASKPRPMETLFGASLLSLTEGEINSEEPCRILSGSVLSGRAAEGSFAYLGRFARQVTLIREDHDQHVLGWILPQPGRFAVQPVLASSFLGRKLYALTSNLNGGRRAMVPTGTFETLMPQDYLPTQLLRALLVKDTDTAQELGALELDEEDLALCTFACPAKYEYGDALRDSLAKIEKEG